MAATILGRMVTFAAMLAIGAFCAWRGMVDRACLRTMIAVSTRVFLPAMVFSTICERMDRALLLAQLPMAALAAAFYGVVVWLVRVLADRLRLDAERSAAFRLTFIFGNTGFIGLPILMTVFPGTGVANLVLFMLVDQVVFWTYGASLACGEKGAPDWLTRLKGFLNPNIVAILIALGCVAADVPFCGAAVDFLATIGAAATPLCMVCLGAMCFFSDIVHVLRGRELYVGAAAKMVALPLLAAPLLGALPVAPDVAASMVLMIAMPPTVLVPLTVETNGGDGPYATALSVTAVALAVFTLPLVAGLIGV
ncbi:MAG: AEC family transporter [Coriobacteriia bacterium]|nr:AEC family transporter [Coriobacteriia bacterium]